MSESISLYKRCFTEDPSEATDVVFRDRLESADRYEKRVYGRLVAVLWLVKKRMRIFSSTVDVPHVVGLCTDPDYRFCGYAKSLLKETLLSLDVPFVTLYPFDHAFYEKMGFGTASYDDEADETAKKTSVDSETLLDLYNDFCAPLDYYFVREKSDFDFYKAVNAPFGENYALLNGGRDGFSSPDEYIPRSYSSLRKKKKGVMVRFVDLKKAIKYLGADFPPVRLTDPFIAGNNGVFEAKKGVLRRAENAERTLDIGELATELFSRLKGYLSDRY